MTVPVAAYIGLGANLGDAAQSVRDAIALLSDVPETRLIARSSLYTSAPIEAGGDDFVNAVVRLDTSLDAHALLHQLQHIEQLFGRERPFRNAPRTLDLDLLLYGSQTINDNVLVVPHPRMHSRAFVLLPLLELTPAIHIPTLGYANELLAAVREQHISKLAEGGNADPAVAKSG
jgi:2-amino-4-hydroxy-6-hydroxymethyldihydropteridine diphosphokinase